MHLSTRTIVTGLMLAFSASNVWAQARAPEAAVPLPPATAQASASLEPQLPPAAAPQLAPTDALQSASDEVKRVARWVIDSGDNARLPFLLVDKVNAQVFVFSSAGRVQGTAPALLGLGRGDRLLVPNDTPMAAMPPPVRITPAGRFVSRLGIDSNGTELLILDYEASLSLHAVVKGTPEERRAERLASVTSHDNRISYGCINVPTAFYSTVVSPTFTGTKGVVYVLPETSSASQLFGFGEAALAPPPEASPSLNRHATQSIPSPAAK